MMPPEKAMLAVEVNRLREENARLREALRGALEAWDQHHKATPETEHYQIRLARAATARPRPGPTAEEAERCRKTPGRCTCGAHITELGDWPKAPAQPEPECGCPVPDCQHHRGIVPYPAKPACACFGEEACERCGAPAQPEEPLYQIKNDPSTGEARLSRRALAQPEETCCRCPKGLHLPACACACHEEEQP